MHSACDHGPGNCCESASPSVATRTCLSVRSFPFLCVLLSWIRWALLRVWAPFNSPTTCVSGGGRCSRYVRVSPAFGGAAWAPATHAVAALRPQPRLHPTRTCGGHPSPTLHVPGHRHLVPAAGPLRASAHCCYGGGDRTTQSPLRRDGTACRSAVGASKWLAGPRPAAAGRGRGGAT